MSNVWLTALALILAPVYIGFLGVESYGLIGFYLSWIAILGILDVGISATASRETAWLAARPEEKCKVPDLLISLEVAYWGIILILGAFFFFGVWFFGENWFQTKVLSPDLIRDALLLMVASLVLQVPSGLYVAGMMGLQLQRECSGLLALLGTVRGLGAILVLWLISPDIRLFFIWQAIVSALQTGVLRWALWKNIGVKGSTPRFSLGILHSVKGFAGGMMLNTIIGIIMSQADKMILSRLVSLTEFGYYTLAWTVASGLSRVAGPVMEAFGPRFTELISKGDEEGLAKELPLASQLMSVLTLPLATLVAFLSTPILFVWLGKQDIAESAAPILSVLIIGTALISCSYPPFRILYSRKWIKQVISVNLVSMILLLPLMILLVMKWGIMGAGVTWVLYGLTLYISAHKIGLSGIPGTDFFVFIRTTFLVPCMISFVVAWLTGLCLSDILGKIRFILFLGLALIACEVAVLLVCKDLSKTVMNKLKWASKEIL